MTLAVTPKLLDKIEHDTCITKMPEIVRFLQDALGQKITAYLSNLNSPKEVGHWIKGTAQPRGFTPYRLRYAYHAARLLTEAYGSNTAKAWFFGANTRLNDQAPAYLLRHSENIDDLRYLVPVAVTFAGSID